MSDRVLVSDETGLGVLGLRDQDKPGEPLRASHGGAHTLTLSYDLFLYKKDLSGGFAAAPIVTVRGICRTIQS